MRPFYPFLAALAFALVPLSASAQITVALSGDWSDPNTWSGGAVPTATDDVVLDSTVTIDIPDAVVRDVTIRGAGDADGELRTARGGANNDAVGITIFGDLVLADDEAELKPLSNQDPDTGTGFGEIYHRITIHGSIDNSNGGTFDMRRGATSTDPPSAAFIDLIFAGDQDATLHLGDYDNNDNQLFRTEIAKENGAKVTLLNDATMDNNSRATFTLTSGYLDTGDFRFTLISNNSSVVVGGSPASYVIGELARGLPKSGDDQYSRSYPIGDADGYRPVSVYSSERPSDDQFFGVRAISGDADTGSSTFEGGLTDVSPFRYYAFEWYFFDSSDPITIDRVEISYGSGEGIPEGSTDFVVATSTNDRATWTNSDGFDADGTTDHTTTLASPPTAIQSADLSGWMFDFEVVGSDVVGDVYYAAVGTTDAFSTSISQGPEADALRLGAAPNPTTSVATVSFELGAPADVTVEVFDVMGRRVATLTEDTLPAGAQELSWDASGLAAGLYHIRLRAGDVIVARTLSVVR